MNAAQQVTSADATDPNGTAPSATGSEGIPSPSSEKSSNIGAWIGFFVIFAFALTIRIWYNFYTVHANCAGCADASEYVRLATGLGNVLGLPTDFWHQFTQCVFGGATSETVASVRSALMPLQELHQSGPIFPLFLLTTLTMFGGLFQAGSLDGAVFAQCLLSALSCALTMAFASRAWDNRVGLLAGAVSAMYPGFIVNSGRLYSESFATFLTCALLALVAQGFFVSRRVLLRAFTIGALACCLQLTRSIFVLFTLGLVPILIVQTRRKFLLSICAFALGLACICAPWVVLQNVAFGKSSLLVDRVGNYNLFIGTNTSTQGWLTFPYPDGTGIEKESLVGLLKKSARDNPNKFLRLLMDKPARLFQSPWNDFRTAIGPFDMRAQSLIHQLILLLGVLGLPLAFLVEFKSSGPGKSQIYCRSLLLFWLSLHTLYALFITVPRYGVTAMPCVIAFASAASLLLLRMVVAAPRIKSARFVLIATALTACLLKLNLVEHLLNSFPALTVAQSLNIAILVRLDTIALLLLSVWFCLKDLSGYRRFTRFAAVLLAVILAPLAILPIRAEGRWFEWQRPLNQATLQQKILLPASLDLKKLPQSYLIVDASNERTLSTSNIIINGKSVKGPIIPGLALTQNYSQLRHETGEKVYWEGEYIFSCMTEPADGSNSQIRQWFFVPIPRDILAKSAGLLDITLVNKHADAGTIFGSYSDHPDVANIPHPAVYSWEKCFYGVENDAGLTDPRLDEKVAIKSVPGQTSRMMPNIRLLIPDTNNQDGIVALKRVSAHPLSVSGEHVQAGIALSTLPKFKAWDLWVINAAGKLATKGSDANPNIRFVLKSKTNSQQYKYQSPWTLRALPSAQTDQDFAMTVPVAPGRMPGGAKSIICEFNLRTPLWKQEFLKPPVGTAEINDLKLDIIKLPNNPLTRFHIY